MGKAGRLEQVVEYIKQLKKTSQKKTRKEAERARKQAAPPKLLRCVSCTHSKLKCPGGNLRASCLVVAIIDPLSTAGCG